MVHEIKPYVEYTVFFNTDNISFGSIPSAELLKVLSNGRQSGVLLEYDVAARFFNLSKEGCGQGDGPDLMLKAETENYKVQCKTARLYTSKGNIRGEKANIGHITKSCLWDKTRGKELEESIWDDTHNSYFASYDYFMFIDISCFPQGFYRVLTVPTKELEGHPSIAFQQNIYHFGKSSRKKIVASSPPTCWNYPIQLTTDMWITWTESKEEIYEQC